MSTKPRFVIPLANPKMSDKLQFVVTYGSGRVVETSDKLKFVGHFHCILALLSNSPAVSFTVPEKLSESPEGTFSPKKILAFP